MSTNVEAVAARNEAWQQRQRAEKAEAERDEARARADVAERRLAALEAATIDGSSGEWYGSAVGVESRSDWPTLMALADASIAAQAQEAKKQ